MNYDADGNPTGTTEVIANVLAPNGDTTCAVTIRVAGTDGAAINSATLAPTVNGAAVPYTNNLDGTYQVIVPKGSAIGYTDGAISATANQTKGWTYTVNVSLTASAQ